MTIPVGAPGGTPKPIGISGLPETVAAEGAGPAGTRFQDVLAAALEPSAPVRFSRHAEERIRSRGIQLTPGDLGRLGRALDEAAGKGAKDSLVLSGGLAYVVNVPSRTVVTALYGDQSRGHVFTQIDSAVVI